MSDPARTPEPSLSMVRQNLPLMAAFVAGLIGYVEMQAEVRQQTQAIAEIKAQAAREREQNVVMLVKLEGIRVDIVALREEFRRVHQRAAGDLGPWSPAALPEPVRR